MYMVYIHMLVELLSYISVIVIIVFIYYELILASNDPKAFTKNLYNYILMIVVPIIVVIGLTASLSFEPQTTNNLIFGIVIAMIAGGTIYYFLQLSLSKYIFNKYLLYLVIASLLLVGASIIVTLFSGTLRKLTGWTGFFINLIFYIPCLIRDGIHAAIQEYQTFSTTLIILFVLELFLLLMYFFLIPFVNNKIFPTSKVLVEDPVMLNTGVPLQVPTDISNNFAVSMWVYLNPGPKGKPGYAVESPIFSYLNEEGKPHIQLSYSNIDQGNNDFIMRVGEQDFPMSLPLQKWNNIVFNYNTFNDVEAKDPTSTEGPTETPTEPPVKSWWERLFNPFCREDGKIQLWCKTPKPTKANTVVVKKTIVDMFVNGNLERSFTYDSRQFPLPIFTSSDIMSIGNGTIPDSSLRMGPDGVEGSTGDNANRDGLYGSICNVVYYNQPLTKMAIIYNYNLLIIRNPPI